MCVSLHKYKGHELEVRVGAEEVGHRHQSHGNGMCGYNVYSRLLTFNLFLDFSTCIAGGRSTVVLSSNLTLLSSNLEYC